MLGVTVVTASRTTDGAIDILLVRSFPRTKLASGALDVQMGGRRVGHHFVICIRRYATRNKGGLLQGKTKRWEGWDGDGKRGA